MTPIEKNPVIHIPQNTETVDTVRASARDYARLDFLTDIVFGGSIDLEDDDSVINRIDELASEESARSITYDNDHFGIVMSNRFGPQLDTEADNLIGGGATLASVVKLHAYEICKTIYTSEMKNTWYELKALHNLKILYAGMNNSEEGADLWQDAARTLRDK